MNVILNDDPTQIKLIEFCKQTEFILTKVLRELDKSSECKIHTSLDLGFPHDLIRIAGGFPTGSIVEWECNIPFVPVDTTVNICTGSIFEISNIDYDVLTESYFKKFQDRINASSYNFNYNRGNHFMIFAKSENTGKQYLLLHSSASEFKKQYNGLYPVKGNWYYDDLKIYSYGNRYLRYITGTKAEMFFRIAKQIETYNSLRQEFIAHSLVNNIGTLNNPKHYHHYYMPNNSSVVIGSYLANENEVVPIFTSVGLPIFMFKVKANTINRINFKGKTKYITPHGWGKKSIINPNIDINVGEGLFTLNEVKQKIDVDSSLRNHPDLKIRGFSTDSNSVNYFFNLVRGQLVGDVLDKYCQIISLTKYGFNRW